MPELYKGRTYFIGSLVSDTVTELTVKGGVLRGEGRSLMGLTALTKVTVDTAVITDGAFTYCENLSDVVIGPNVFAIGSMEYFPSEATITVDDGNLWYEMRDGALIDERLNMLVYLASGATGLPSGVTLIAPGAISGYYETFILPENMTVLDMDIFSGASIDTIVLPDRLASVTGDKRLNVDNICYSGTADEWESSGSAIVDGYIGSRFTTVYFYAEDPNAEEVQGINRWSYDDDGNVMLYLAQRM